MAEDSGGELEKVPVAIGKDGVTLLRVEDGKLVGEVEEGSYDIVFPDPPGGDDAS